MPMSEIDFSLSQTLGMSYKSLPRDYPLPACSGRTPLCEAVLNDEWVSVPRPAPPHFAPHPPPPPPPPAVRAPAC